MNYDKKALQAAEKAFSEAGKQVQKETKDREEAAKSIKSLGDAAKETSGRSLRELQQAINGSAKKTEAFSSTLDEAAKSFQKGIENFVKKLPLGEQAIEDPVAFSFKKDIPILGSYVRLLEGLGSAIEGALASVVKVFTEDFTGLWGDAIEVVFENVKRKINRNLRESREIISGIQGIPDQLTNELGPLSKYVNKDFALGYYNFQRDYIIKPIAAGRQNIADFLGDQIAEDSLKEAKKGTASTGSSILDFFGNFEFLNNLGGLSYGGYMANNQASNSSWVSNQMKGKT